MNNLDQFFTNPDVVNNCIETIDFKDYDIVIEPSAGDGSFYNKITGEKIGIDLDPKIKGLIQHFEDKKTRIKTPSECGYREVVNIKPFGDIVAKFDTGNSGTNVIHAENIKVNGNNVTWTLNDKTITSKIIKKVKIGVGGLRNYNEERYLINLDVEFMGTIYTEVDFTLDNREGRQKILLDREFMNRLNVMVNPSRRFVVTTPYTIDK